MKMKVGLSALSTIAGSVALAAVACSGAPIGGRGAGGTGGDSSPCPDSTRCVSGSGGELGTGGAGAGDAGNGAPCTSQLTDAYSAAVTAALACTPGAPNQCQALVAIAPTACLDCGGEEFVNDATEVEALRQKWLAACESTVDIECLQIACSPPLPPSVCVPTGGAGTTTGTCTPAPMLDGGTADAGRADAAFDGGESCDQLSADYTAAVTAARACTPGAPNQCQSAVSPMPSGCPLNGCGPETYVDDPTEVNAVRARWISRCAGVIGCPQIACLPPAVAVSCVPVDGGGGATAGTCVAGAIQLAN